MHDGPTPPPPPPQKHQVRLVAVSKLKPASDILALHRRVEGNGAHLDFGENYAQELVEKAGRLPSTIRWHFIGGLQTNKCLALAQIPNLFVVSSVDAVKKADALNRGRAQLISSSSSSEGDNHSPPPQPLGIHVQINTSGESSKSGVPPDQAAALCRHIRDSCPHLRLRGLMTIGAIARSSPPQTAENQTSNDNKNNDNDNDNEDFRLLRATRDDVLAQLRLHPSSDNADDITLELSMGMSNDFETAVRMGSDEVRVGSAIFGERPSKTTKKEDL